MNLKAADLDTQWLEYLCSEFEHDYFRSLLAFLRLERQSGKIIYPPEASVFKALNVTPLASVRVVILGQDPYHGPNQAHGLSFSVMPGLKVPPSLRNIYKELQLDLGCDVPEHGHLTAWAEQGVLLLNAVLSVEHAEAGSHQGKGWERFTDKVIEVINSECDNVVFMLWGAYAQKKGKMIDRDKHLVLSAPHPSPLSAHRGFFGCGHFSKANDYLLSKHKSAIDWQVR